MKYFNEIAKDIKQIELNESDLVVQLLERDEIRILDKCDGNHILVCVHSELTRLIKALEMIVK